MRRTSLSGVLGVHLLSLPHDDHLKWSQQCGSQYLSAIEAVVARAVRAAFIPKEAVRRVGTPSHSPSNADRRCTTLGLALTFALSCYVFCLIMVHNLTCCALVRRSLRFEVTLCESYSNRSTAFSPFGLCISSPHSTNFWATNAHLRHDSEP